VPLWEYTKAVLDWDTKSKSWVVNVAGMKMTESEYLTAMGLRGSELVAVNGSHEPYDLYFKRPKPET
jgi:hypothetical protein